MGGAKHSSFARKNGEIVASRGQIDSEKYLASTSHSLRKLSPDSETKAISSCSSMRKNEAFSLPADKDAPLVRS